ncbi:MAG TPA: YjgN family protein [Burkholderiaceae bacterium]|nr:YjgN family protein [Burkholderiaceae bacterium]
MGRTTTSSGELSLSLRRPNAAYQIPVRFTGRGGDYFWIWIVNLALTILTLSLYRPWARVRALRYFCGHTQIRKHPLHFRGDPWKMLRSQLLVTVLVLGYAFSYAASPRASVLGFVSLAVLWPALFRASMQARLAHTSWRGVRFGFEGSLRGAYLFFSVPVLVVVALAAASAALPGKWQTVAVVLSLSMLYALVPWFYWLMKKYQHDHFTFAHYKAELRMNAGPFYGVFLRTTGAALLVALVSLVALVGLAAMTWGTLQPLTSSKAALDAARQTGMALAPLVGLTVFAVLLLQAVLRAHFIARMQDLVWSRTGSRVFRFKSELPTAPLVRMLFKHGVLMVLTLGLYYPFAQVELARARLQALTLVSRATLDELVGFGQGGEGPRESMRADMGL